MHAVDLGQWTTPGVGQVGWRGRPLGAVMAAVGGEGGQLEAAVGLSVVWAWHGDTVRLNSEDGRGGGRRDVTVGGMHSLHTAASQGYAV